MRGERQTRQGEKRDNRERERGREGKSGRGRKRTKERWMRGRTTQASIGGIARRSTYFLPGPHDILPYWYLPWFDESVTKFLAHSVSHVTSRTSPPSWIVENDRCDALDWRSNTCDIPDFDDILLILCVRAKGPRVRNRKIHSRKERRSGLCFKMKN